LEAEEGELRDKAQDIKIVKDTNNNNKEVPWLQNHLKWAFDYQKKIF
jgi:hypothetical protein